MTNIFNANLLDLLPPNLKTDKDIIAASHAVDKEINNLANSIKDVLTFADIDHVSEKVLENIAYEMNTDFYDNSLSLDVKRKLVKDAYIYKFAKGTPYAIERLINSIFGDGRVEEWFEYGGQPYHFKVYTANEQANTEKAQQFIDAVNSVKNARSFLEQVIIEKVDNMDLYIGCIVHTGDNITLRQVN